MDTRNKRSSLRKTIACKDDETTEVRLGRRISFSGKKFVRIFDGEEEPKHWDNSYEVSDHTNNDEVSGATTIGTISGNRSNTLSKSITHIIRPSNDDKENIPIDSKNGEPLTDSGECSSLNIENSVNFTLLPLEIKRRKEKEISTVGKTTSRNSSDMTTDTLLNESEKAGVRKAKAKSSNNNSTENSMHEGGQIAQEFNPATIYMDESLGQVGAILNKRTSILQVQDMSIDNNEKLMPSSTVKNHVLEMPRISKETLALNEAVHDFDEKLKEISMYGDISDESMIFEGGKKSHKQRKTLILNEDLNIEVKSKINKTQNYEATHMSIEASPFQPYHKNRKTIILNEKLNIEAQTTKLNNNLRWDKEDPDCFEKVNKNTRKTMILNEDLNVENMNESLNVFDDSQMNMSKIQNGTDRIAMPPHSELKEYNTKNISSTSTGHESSSLGMDLSYASPLIPPEYFLGDSNKKLNLRELNDAIEHGKIHIFPAGAKTPTTDKKNKKQLWFASKPGALSLNDDAKTDSIVSPFLAKQQTCRYSQADELMLDNTNFLTQAKLGDETQSRNTSKWSAKHETMHPDNVNEFQIHCNSQGSEKFGSTDSFNSKGKEEIPILKSRKSLHFDISPSESTDNIVQKNQNSSEEESEKFTLTLRNEQLKLKSCDTLEPCTPLKNRLGQCKLRKNCQLTPGCSLIEFEDLEEECESSNHLQNYISVRASKLDKMEVSDMNMSTEPIAYASIATMQNSRINKRTSVYLHTEIEMETVTKVDGEKDCHADYKQKSDDDSHKTSPSFHNPEQLEQRSINEKRRITTYQPIDIELEPEISTDVYQIESKKINQGAYCRIRRPISATTTYMHTEIEMGTVMNADHTHDSDRFINCHANDMQKSHDSTHTSSASTGNPELVEQVNTVSKEKRRITTYQPIDIELEPELSTEAQCKNDLIHSNNEDKQVTYSKRRQTIHKPVDIVTEIEPEDVAPQSPIQNISEDEIRPAASEKRRQTTYEPVDIIPDRDLEVKGYLSCLPAINIEDISVNDVLNNMTEYPQRGNLCANDEHIIKLQREIVVKDLLNDSRSPKFITLNAKRLPVNLTPILPTSKKRQTMIFNDCVMDEQYPSTPKSVSEQIQVSNRMDTNDEEVITNQSYQNLHTIATANSVQFIELNDTKQMDTCNATPETHKKSFVSCHTILSENNNQFFASPCHPEVRQEDCHCLDQSAQVPRSYATASRGSIVDYMDWNIEDVNVNATQMGPKSCFEGNPITISDVSAHFLKESKTTKSNTQPLENRNSMRKDSEDFSQSGFKSVAIFNKNYLNLTSDTTLFCGGSSSPKDDIENTRLSLVETLIDDVDVDDNEDGDGNGMADQLFELPSINNVADTVENRRSTKPANEVIVCSKKCKRCAGSLNSTQSTASDSFVLPQLPTLSDSIAARLQRLRCLRDKPMLSDVHEYWRRKSLEEAFNKNATVEASESLKTPENRALSLIENYRKAIDSFAAGLHREVNRKIATKTERFVLRLEALLDVECSNLIFDYQLEGRGKLLFYHQKVMMLRIIIDFDELDDLGTHIRVTAVRVDFKRVSEQNWLPFHYLLRDQFLLRLPFNLERTLENSSELAVCQMLQNIDKHCVETRTVVGDLWKVVCKMQAELIRDDNRNIVRKIQRKIIANEGESTSIVKSEFLIEITNVETICFKDILQPQIYLFDESLQYLPIGIKFLNAFLDGPAKYLK